MRLTVLPTAAADAVTATAGSTTTGNVLTNDLGTGLTVTGSSAPAHGSATVRPDGSYSYTPAAGFSGTDSFTYTVTDGSGGTDTVTVTVQVAPAAQDDTVTVAAGGTATAGTRATGVLGNDSGTGLTVASNTSPSHGALTLDKATGTFTYTPTDGYSGPDAFTYTAVDGSGSPSTATVTITVNPTIADRHRVDGLRRPGDDRRAGQRPWLGPRDHDRHRSDPRHGRRRSGRLGRLHADRRHRPAPTRSPTR